jgi:hypothetical protein
MGRKKYPLEPLARVRRDRVEASARELGAAVRLREEAEKNRVAAELERTHRLAEASEVRDGESRALGHGVLTAADLQRQGAWQARMHWEDEEAARAVSDLAAREEALRDSEGRAKALVAQREADSKVVLEHQTKWKDTERRAEDAAEEEAAAEAWRPRPK